MKIVSTLLAVYTLIGTVNAGTMRLQQWSNDVSAGVTLTTAFEHVPLTPTEPPKGNASVAPRRCSLAGLLWTRGPRPNRVDHQRGGYVHKKRR